MRERHAGIASVVPYKRRLDATDDLLPFEGQPDRFDAIGAFYDPDVPDALKERQGARQLVLYCVEALDYEPGRDSGFFVEAGNNLMQQCQEFDFFSSQEHSIHLSTSKLALFPALLKGFYAGTGALCGLSIPV